MRRADELLAAGLSLVSWVATLGGSVENPTKPLDFIVASA
jgi:hypothetical protein